MAGAFRFRLQRVLDYRTQLEEQAKIELAKALHEQRVQADVLADLRRRLEVHETKLYAEKELTADDVWLWRLYKDRLQFDIKAAEAGLLKLVKKVDRCRRELVTKSKDRKLLEKLKTNQAVKFRVEENLKEQSESDEMATLRYQHGNV
ncbi:MAG: flagellar export protein FliJ [Thermodesulfobacteriota bacterium]|nr:flagellar export protein FliJ [Thermodesulfobacteriota bacterium]